MIYNKKFADSKTDKEKLQWTQDWKKIKLR